MEWVHREMHVLSFGACESVQMFCQNHGLGLSFIMHKELLRRLKLI